MHDDADFLRAILVDPFDDAPRLVYAEWLEDRAHESGGGEQCGRCKGKRFYPYRSTEYGYECERCRGTGRIPDNRAARAEFIRVQIDLSNSRHGGIPKEQFKTLKNRETELLSKMKLIFVGDIPIIWNDIRRGFVASISCTLAAFMSHAADIFSRHPVTEVRLTDREPQASRLYHGTYRWYTDDIPIELYTQLIGIYPTGSDQPYWSSVAAANLALSRACVDYGRSLAGLPPLTWPAMAENELSGISG